MLKNNSSANKIIANSQYWPVYEEGHKKYVVPKSTIHAD